MKVVERGRSVKYVLSKPRVYRPKPAVDPDSGLRPLAADDLRRLDVVAINWLGAWILCDVHAYELDGTQVSLRSRDPAHLFGWVDSAELLGRVSRGVASGVRLYDADSACERMSDWARRVLDGRRSAAGFGRVGRFVRRRDGSGGVD